MPLGASNIDPPVAILASESDHLNRGILALTLLFWRQAKAINQTEASIPALVIKQQHQEGR
jgi:hypothetical protein